MTTIQEDIERKLPISKDLIDTFVIYPKKNKRKDKNDYYKCGFCEKKFIRKKYFEKHILICEQLHYQREIQESKKVKEANQQEEDDILTHNEMSYLIRVLIQKCEKLENELDDVKKFTKKVKKEISILDWLNDNLQSEKTFIEWIEDFEVERNLVQGIFENDFIIGMIEILHNVFPLENTNNHPIKCFNQKKNLFYIYDYVNVERNREKNNMNNVENENNYREKKWRIMDKQTFDKMIMIFIKKCLKIFFIWKEENIDRIKNDEDFHDIYVLNMRKVMGSTKKDEIIYKRITTNLYNYLKCNVKNIIEYEFAF